MEFSQHPEADFVEFSRHPEADFVELSWHPEADFVELSWYPEADFAELSWHPDPEADFVLSYNSRTLPSEFSRERTSFSSAEKAPSECGSLRGCFILQCKAVFERSHYAQRRTCAHTLSAFRKQLGFADFVFSQYSHQNVSNKTLK